jgi:hypothetical protein
MRFKEADPLREANKANPSGNNAGNSAGKVRAKVSGRAALPARLPIEWLDPMSWRLPSGQALADFALQSGFLAPLMLGSDMGGIGALQPKKKSSKAGTDEATASRPDDKPLMAGQPVNLRRLL